MNTFKITRQVGNPDFQRVVGADLATMGFLSCNEANTTAIICVVVVENATYLRVSDRSPRNSFCERSRCTPVVFRSFEQCRFKMI
ncbi:hypothetical protein TNCV_1634021 [Trichonephila clavipes]|nr:hypothetical protein TNCV_1634021 [Trichonephila clavipes]